jgi:uncharacterized protein (TIGR02147 family)
MTPASEESILPSQILQRVLQGRIARNSAYSLRAFARDLGLSHTYLSLVLSGRKSVSVERASAMAEMLAFTRTETQRFVRSAVLSSSARRGAYGYLKNVLKAEEAAASSKPHTKSKDEIEFHDLEQERFRAMGNWWHFAILDLLTCDDARRDLGWIARRLGISQTTARDAVERLLRLNLLEDKNGRWVKTKQHILAKVNRPDTLVRIFHKDMLSKALQTLSDEDGVDEYSRRDLLSMTVAVNPAKISEAKELVGEFQRKIVACLTSGPCDEVYQMNVQLMPLTRLRKVPK